MSVATCEPPVPADFWAWTRRDRRAWLDLHPHRMPELVALLIDRQTPHQREQLKRRMMALTSGATP